MSLTAEARQVVHSIWISWVVGLGFWSAVSWDVSGNYSQGALVQWAGPGLLGRGWGRRPSPYPVTRPYVWPTERTLHNPGFLLRLLGLVKLRNSASKEGPENALWEVVEGTPQFLEGFRDGLRNMIFTGCWYPAGRGESAPGWQSEPEFSFSFFFIEVYSWFIMLC